MTDSENAEHPLFGMKRYFICKSNIITDSVIILLITND